MSKRKIKLIAQILLYIGATILALTAILNIENNYIFMIGIVLVVSYLLLLIIFWKCPHCGKQLPLGTGSIKGLKRCPKCQQELDFTSME